MLIGRPIIVFLLLLLPAPLYAHMRWFVNPSTIDTGVAYSMDAVSITVLAGALLFCGSAILVHRFGATWSITKWVVRFSKRTDFAEWRAISVLSGVMLLINAVSGVFLAPNLSYTHPFMQVVGSAAQGFLGLLLVLQVSFILSGLLILGALLMALLTFGPLLMLDYLFEFTALGAALMVIGPRLTKLDQGLAPHFGLTEDKQGDLALPIIRIGTGLTLCVLAVHNKLGNPAFVQAFLDHQDLNFMAALGFSNFTDLNFGFSAGIAEFSLGALLIFGVATRFTTCVLAFFFVCTLVVIGPTELVGHAPLFGIAALLVIEGAGSWSTQTQGRKFRLGAVLVVGAVMLAGVLALTSG